MKRKFARFGAVFLSIYLLTQSASATTLLIPGGEVIGMHLQDDTVTVADFDPTAGQAARSAGLQAGDRLVAIDGKPIHCVSDVRAALLQCDNTVKLSVRRGDKTRTLTFRPAITETGKKLGVYLRQGTSGLGTVTYYTPEGEFGALGHSVNDPSGQILSMTAGEIFKATVSGVKKGTIGTPGQLLGAVTGNSAGNLNKNTAQGVFGKGITGKTPALPVAETEQIRTGPATIRSTVGGQTPRD